jgi:hypothetical protein
MGWWADWISWLEPRSGNKQPSGLPPIRNTLSEGFSYFVTSIAAPAASGWSGRQVGLAPTEKRRLVTAHTHYVHWSH